jgi:hypothetical protein
MRPSGPRRVERGTAPANGNILVYNTEFFTICSILMTRDFSKIIFHLFKTGKVFATRLGDGSYLYLYHNIQ